MRFAEDEQRLAYRDELDEILRPHFRTQPAQYWLDRMIEHSIPCAMVENVASIAESPISDEYGAFSSVKPSREREMRFVRNPIAPLGEHETPAPALGEHTKEILRELDLL